MKNIDQVTLSILVNNLYWIAEEMNVYLCQAAFSTNIKVRRDCSCALYTRNGDLIAQGEFIPVHLGIMSRTLKALIDKHPVSEMKEGDVYIHNDPFQMGSHLWDVMLFQPIYFKGTLVAFVGNLAHHVDIGGAPVYHGIRTIFEEGLRLPPIKLYKEGKIQEDILNIILTNVRTPYESKGDLAAQTAANYRGEIRIKELAEKYGADTLIEYFEEILNYSERGMREAIDAIPDGEAEFEDYIEHNGIEDHMTKIKVKLTVKGNELFFDFTGSGEAGAGGVNSPWSLTHSAVYYGVKSVLGANIPTNQGAYRPIHLMRHEEESIVDARFPHAVNMCTTNPSQRIVDVVIGAFAKLVPEKCCACDGHWVPGRFVGIDPRTGRYSSYVETYAAGRGAKYNDDGADAHQTHMTNTANAPIEIIELEHPLRVDKYALVQDSCGAGTYRGGVGITRELTALADMSVTVSYMRPTIHPYGLFSGEDGGTDYCAIHLRNGDTPQSSNDVQAGDKIVVRTSGGGGWGDPTKRDIWRVEADVLDGYVSLKAAENIYKVIIDSETMKVDEAKTVYVRGKRC